MAIEHTGILQIHVSVTDIERSVAFYRDVLGLQHLFTVKGQPMALFDAVGVRLYLAVPEGRAVPVPAGRLLRGG
ncbi:MAG: VOC family protein [Geodermatophilaceae bacterium]